MGQTGGFANKPGGGSLVQRRAEGDPSPGKQTLVQQSGDVHAAAARGLAGPATQLPHLDTIQRSFGGEHDLSKVQAHVGGAAEEATGAMGASAYATGDH